MNDRVELKASVPQEMHGHRLDQVAAQLFPQYSRSRLQDWIKRGALSVDGQQRRPRDKVSGGA
jgi:23S rRNA pseudouridine1911/1915/1917 synthase